MDTFAEMAGIVLIGIIGVVVFALIFALPEMWLWNALMPDIFGLKEITWMQAAGLSLLCGFLFKSTPATKSE